jgi:acetamidase/formamidase
MDPRLSPRSWRGAHSLGADPRGLLARATRGLACITRGLARTAFVPLRTGCVLALAACAAPEPDSLPDHPVEADHFVPSRPETVSWGWYPLDKEPVLTVRSGETVRINTLTHAGATQSEEPVAYLTALGVPREEIPQDVIDFWASREGRPREGRSGHVITGPVYVEGADPGDMLEVQILSLETRVPWGVNNTSATGGVFSPDYPGARPGDPLLDIPGGTRHLIRTGMVDGREVAFFADGIQVPLAPFMGILAVAPDPVVGQPGVTVAGVQSSRPPGAFGGNLDVKDLTVGTTVYLPVFQPGALFYTGDPHGAQGDGEVSGTAIEQSLSGVFRFVVHEGVSLSGPRAETATHHLLMGIDLDLDRAARNATWEVVDFLTAEKGLSPAEALSLASIAVDFRVSEVVDLTQVVTAFVPKSIFPR